MLVKRGIGSDRIGSDRKGGGGGGSTAASGESNIADRSNIDRSNINILKRGETNYAPTTTTCCVDTQRGMAYMNMIHCIVPDMPEFATIESEAWLPQVE